MKIFIVLLAIMLGIWLWKRGRESSRNDAIKSKPPKPTQPQQAAAARPIVPCLHCGTHVDMAETVEGRLGRYCSKAHCTVHGDRPL
jgi:uncharacterized protein